MKETQPTGKPPAQKIKPLEKLSPSTNAFMGMDVGSLEEDFVDHLEFSLAKDEYSATKRDCFVSLALTVRDRLIERWIETQQSYYREGAKRVYYLSMEFLVGRLLGNALINLGLYQNIQKALHELGYTLEDLRELEAEAGLGNGGLGRLAACFMDSMATLELPGYGYGIRYEYGIFSQRIKEGNQVEAPDKWLRFGNPWEIERPEYSYPVKFYGKVNEYTDKKGRLRFDWADTDDVMAMAYDIPVPGYRNNTVNNLRLWSAKSSHAFNLDYFNHGDYERAVLDKIQSEVISTVLYPRDDVFQGRELRLKQEYFLASATLQDIVRRFKKTHPEKTEFQDFSDKVAIQLNDTHPTIGIPELMRILIDIEGLDWEPAWQITVETFGYTNHTILPEALENWPVNLLARVLPRHVQIIYEINRRFMQDVGRTYPNDVDRLRTMSIIGEGQEQKVRMARLAMVGSHSINGVSALHTEILKKHVFKDFYEFCPEKFNNKTNGITPRRWLKVCNPELAQLISNHIGEGWVTDLYQLKKLLALAEDASFRKEWRRVKRSNKKRLARYIARHNNLDVNLDSLFDCQAKRIHEYKRQILNALHCVTLYNRIKANPQNEHLPRTVIFTGKAAPGYFMAKLSIKLINSIAEVVNNDPEMDDKLKVVFLANYCVTLAERIIPAADLSEQISTAGTEASGTGNMKFALNGALTIGTLDGANIEVREEVGEENIFIFGLKADEVTDLKQSGYRPRDYYANNSELKQVIDMIKDGYFSKSQPDLFEPIIDTLLDQGDQYMVLADYADYVNCQERISTAYRDQSFWTRMSVVNVASMGKFSSDRAIQEYAQDIWHAKPVPITIPKQDEFKKHEK